MSLMRARALHILLHHSASAIQARGEPGWRLLWILLQCACLLTLQMQQEKIQRRKQCWRPPSVQWAVAESEWFIEPLETHMVSFSNSDETSFMLWWAFELTQHQTPHTSTCFLYATMSNAWTENRSRAHTHSQMKASAVQFESVQNTLSFPKKKHRALKCCIYSVSHAPSFMRDSPETAAPVNRESDAPRCFKVRLRLRVRRRRACCWLWCADGSAVPLILKREKSGGSVRRAASEKHSTGKKQSWGANIRQQCCSSGWRDGESDCCWETRRETRRRRRASLYWIVEEGDGRQKGEGLKHIQCLEERERDRLYF